MEEDPKDETFLSKRDPCKTVKDKKMKMKLVKRLSKISPTYGTPPLHQKGIYPIRVHAPWILNFILS